MNEGGHLQMLSIIRNFEFECRHAISAWTLNSQFVILGTISGSLLYHKKSNSTKSCIVAFAELMDTITTIQLMSNRTNDLVIGTKKGILGLVQVRCVNHKITDQHYQAITKFEEEVIEVIVYSNQTWVVCTSQKIVLIKYQTDLEGMIKIREKRILFEPEGQIIQVNKSEDKVLVSTWKSYFVIDLKTSGTVQIGSKEKQGIYGATFIHDDNKELVVYAARPLGRIWKANSTTGRVLNTLQFFSENGNKLNVGLLKDFSGKCIVSYNSDGLTVFDCHSNEILREEKFQNDFLLLLDQNCASGYFYILLQEKEKIIIKSCSLKTPKEVFSDCFELHDGDEAIRTLLKHEELWSKGNIEKIFDNKEHIQNQSLLEDSRFIKIVEKQIEEASLHAQKVVEINLEDFENVEYKLPESTKLEIQGIQIEKKILKIESVEEKDGQLCSVELGKEFLLKSQIQIRKQTKRIRNLRNKSHEKLEFISLLESLGMIIRNELIKNFEKEKLCRILKQNTQFYFPQSQRMVFYCVKSVLFAQDSLISIEQINIKYGREIRLGFAKSMIAQLLFKKHIYGFLNQVERKFFKELICFQKICS